MSQERHCLRADINTASSGDNTLVAAVAATSDGIPAMPIKVWGLSVECSGGANNLIYKNGTTAFNASAITLSSGGSDYYNNMSEPRYVVSPGNAFKLNLSAATQVTGYVLYTLG